MQEWNKKNMIFGAVLATVGLTAFSTVAMLTGGGWLAYVLPLVAEGYGLYHFYKKYMPKKEDDKKEGKQ